MIPQIPDYGPFIRFLETVVGAFAVIIILLVVVIGRESVKRAPRGDR